MTKNSSAFIRFSTILGVITLRFISIFKVGEVARRKRQGNPDFVKIRRNPETGPLPAEVRHGGMGSV